MNIYKIIFDMKTPIAYMDLPVFDSLIAYCVYKKRSKLTDYHTPQGNEVEKIDIPIELHKYNFYLASYMFVDKQIESIESWKKRWCSKHDRIAYFGKAKRRIHTGSGQFKSFQIPILIQSIKYVYFFFKGNKDKIKDLLQFLIGIGKKTKIGYGWIKDFMIINALESEIKYIYYRPLPKKNDLISFALKNFGAVSPALGSFSLPYWLPKNQTNIIKPIITEGKEE